MLCAGGVCASDRNRRLRFFLSFCGSRILQLENQLLGMHHAKKRARLEDEKYEMESQSRLLQEKERLHKVRVRSL